MEHTAHPICFFHGLRPVESNHKLTDNILFVNNSKYVVLVFRTTELSEYKNHPVYFTHGLTPVGLKLMVRKSSLETTQNINLWVEGKKRKEKINKLEYVIFEVLARVLLKS